MIVSHSLVMPVLLGLLVAFGLPGCQPSADTTLPAPVVITGEPIILTPTPLPTSTVAPNHSPTMLTSSPEVRSSPTETQVSPTAIPLATPTRDATPPPAPDELFFDTITIGQSYGGRPVVSYRFGSGANHIVIVGGMHGGYEWNSILLADRLREHFQLASRSVPATVTLHIIPNANPDGLYTVTGHEGPFTPADLSDDTFPGRFNGNGVDLNRNWDCNWTANGLWRNQPVSGGANPFSEPESQALRDYLLAQNPALVLFLHSAANAIYVSGCATPHPTSHELALIYGQASGYPVFELFEHYPITGDAGDWLTTQGIASFTVELFSHESLDWDQNLAGVNALLNHYAGQPHVGGVSPIGEQEITP